MKYKMIAINCNALIISFLWIRWADTQVFIIYHFPIENTATIAASDIKRIALHATCIHNRRNHNNVKPHSTAKKAEVQTIYGAYCIHWYYVLRAHYQMG